MRFLAFLLILLPGFALAQTAEEERDRGILQAFIEDNLSAAGRTVRIDGFRGALSSRATLDRLSIADDEGVWLVLENATLDWTRSALLRGRLDITELSAERLTLTRLPETGPEAPRPEAEGFVFALPELPVSIDVQELRIGRADFGAAVLGEPVSLNLTGSASLADGAGEVALAVERLDGPQGEISVTGAYSNATRDLSLAMEFREAPGGIAAGLLDLPGDPSVDLVLSGTGTLDDFTADLTLATDGTERIAGEITLGALPAEGDAPPDRRFGADIDGDLAPLLDPEYREFVGESITLDVAGIQRGDGRLELERLAVETGSVSLAGSLALGTDSWPERIAVEGEIASPDGGEVLLAIPGPRTWIDRAVLTIGYDASADDEWTADVTVTGLRQADLEVEQAGFRGEGVLERGEGAAVGRVLGRLALDLTGIALDDPALAAAVGPAFEGSVGFDYTEDEPLLLNSVFLVSGSATLSGDAVVSGFRAGMSPSIEGDVALSTGSLSRFAPLAGFPLTGGGDLTLSGRLDPIGGGFDLELTGATQDLGIGNPVLDPLIAGTGEIDVKAVRDSSGLRAERLSIATPATELTASGDIATGASEITLALSVADAAVIEPGLAGPASIRGTAVQTGDLWTLAAEAEAPGGAAALIDGTLTIGPDGPGAVTGIAEVVVGSLAPYSALAGRDLAGGLNVTLAGTGDVGAGTLEASVIGMASDIAVGLPPVDALMAGTAELTVDLARDDAGLLTIRTGRFETPQGMATVAGTLGADGAEMELAVDVPDIAPIVPDLAGPATATGTVSQSGDDWKVAADIAAPGGVAATLRGRVAVVDGVPGAATVTLDIAAGTLAPYAALAGRDLGGSIDLTLTADGDLETRTGTATLAGTTRDLVLGIDIADRLMAGATTLDLAAGRDATGRITLERAEIENAQAQIAASGVWSGDAANATFDAALADIGLVEPRLSGPASAVGSVVMAGMTYEADLELAGPGGLAGTVAGRMTLEDGTPGSVAGEAMLEATDLAAYSELAQRELAGAATLTLTVDGDLRDLTGRAELAATGRDLSIGVEGTNDVLAGDTRLTLAIARAPDGPVTVESGRFESPAADAVLSGQMTLRDGAPDDVDGRAALEIRDMAAIGAVLDRDMSGAATLDLEIDGNVAALTGEATVEATGSDLVLGIAGLDGLLAGETRLDLAASRDTDGRIVVETGRFESPAADATLAGALTLTDGTPGAVSGQAALNIRDLTPVGTLLDREMSGAVALDLKVDGDLAALIGEATLTANGDDMVLGIAAIDGLLAGDSRLNLAISRAADGPAVVETGRFDSAAVSADLAGRLDFQNGTPGEIDVTADVDIPRLAAFGALTGRDLGGSATIALSAAGDLRDMTGRAEVRATGQNLTIGLDGATDVLAGETVLDLALSRGSEGPIEIETGRFESAAADVDLAGQVSLEDGRPRALAMTATVDVERLGAFSTLVGRDLGGSLALDATVDADLADLTGRIDATGAGRNVAIGIPRVDALLRGRSELALTASRDAAGRIAIDAGRFETATASVEAAGTLGEDGAQLSFDARLTDLAVLEPRLAGPASLAGVVTQTGDDWQMQAGLSAPGGVAGNVAAAVTMTEAGPGAATLALDLEAETLAPYSRLAGQELGGGVALTISAEGDLSSLAGQARIEGRTFNLSTGIDAADKLLLGTGNLTLALDRRADGTVVIQEARARTPQISAETTGRTGASGTALTYDIRLANLGLFAPGFDGPVRAQGTLRPDGQDFQNLQLSARIDGVGVTARVDGSYSIASAQAALAITGTAPLAVANSFIAPNLISGTARFDLRLNGPLALASLSGNVTTRDAAFTMPAIPLRLTGIGADIRLSGGRAQVSVDAGVSNGGRVRVNGPVTLSAPFQADLGIEVVSVKALDPGLYETVVNGRVAVQGALAGGATISGVLNLGAVEARIPDGGGLTSVNLSGIAHEHEPNRVLRTRIRAGLVQPGGGDAGGGSGGGGGVAYPLDLTVNAPNRIFVRGRGLDAELGGSLRLTGTTANVVTQGGFELIRGRLDILGERLVLTEGIVRMQGNLDPYIRMVATTNSGGVEVRIVIEGFASAPELTITSVPDLPEEEILARLIFKRGLGEISAVQAVQLGLAIRTLAGGGGEGILDRLRTGFGLDDFDVATNETGNTELRLGTYVTDNLYTGVAVDSTGRSQINLNLQITPNVTARGSVASDGETGIGVFFERDY